MMPGISMLSVDDVDPEMRRDRALQLEHDADHADIGDRVVAALPVLGQVRDHGVDVRRRHRRDHGIGACSDAVGAHAGDAPVLDHDLLDLRRKPDVAAHARQWPDSALTSVSEPPSI